MEKQLEDFIIHNWDNTELGKKYNLIIEDGELLSQQYRTDIGPIDILAKDKKNWIICSYRT
jgi:restriction system protein